MAVIVDRRLYLAADNETLVEDGDPQAAFLWATEGDEVTDDEAERVGYKPSKKAAPKPSDKQRSRPSEDKSAPPRSLDDMTKDELLDEADHRGVDVAKSSTKAEIIEALESED